MLERRHIWHRRHLKFCWSRWRFGSKFGSRHQKRKEKKEEEIKQDFDSWKLRIHSETTQGYKGRNRSQSKRATEGVLRWLRLREIQKYLKYQKISKHFNLLNFHVYFLFIVIYLFRDLCALLGICLDVC